MVNQASICSIGPADVRATGWTHAIAVVEAAFCLTLSLERTRALLKS
jgi:hypothetical protein